MSVAQIKAARRKANARYGLSPAKRGQGRSIKQAIEAEAKKAARAARIKR